MENQEVSGVAAKERQREEWVVGRLGKNIFLLTESVDSVESA